MARSHDRAQCGGKIDVALGQSRPAALERRVDRNQKVGPGIFETVPGEIEDRGVGLGRKLGEPGDGRFGSGAPGVLQLDHTKALRREGSADRLGIARGVGQRGPFVGRIARIADHQHDPVRHTRCITRGRRGDLRLCLVRAGQPQQHCQKTRLQHSPHPRRQPHPKSEPRALPDPAPGRNRYRMDFTAPSPLPRGGCATSWPRPSPAQPGAPCHS